MKQESHATVHASSKVTKDTESQWAVTSFQTKNIMPTNQIHGCQRDFQTQCQLDGCLRIYRSFVIQIFSTEFPSDLRGLHRIKIWWYKVRRRGEQVQADQKRELKSRTCKAKEKGKKKKRVPRKANKKTSTCTETFIICLEMMICTADIGLVYMWWTQSQCTHKQARMCTHTHTYIYISITWLSHSLQGIISRFLETQSLERVKDVTSWVRYKTVMM